MNNDDASGSAPAEEVAPSQTLPARPRLTLVASPAQEELRAAHMLRIQAGEYVVLSLRPHYPRTAAEWYAAGANNPLPAAVMLMWRNAKGGLETGHFEADNHMVIESLITSFSQFSALRGEEDGWKRCLSAINLAAVEAYRHEGIEGVRVRLREGGEVVLPYARPALHNMLMLRMATVEPKETGGKTWQVVAALPPPRTGKMGVRACAAAVEANS